ncbi:WD40 repeat domain-containing protein [Nocardia takedensis]
MFAVACTQVDRRPVAVTSSYDKTLRVWELDVAEHSSPPPSSIDRLYMDAVGPEHITTAVSDHGFDRAKNQASLRVLDLTTGAEHMTLGPTSGITAITFTDIDARPIVLTGHSDCAVRMWDADSGLELAALSGHSEKVSGIVCTRLAGRPIAISTDKSSQVRLWDLENRTPLAVFDHPAEVTRLSHSTVDDRPVVVTDCKDSTIRVWDLKTDTIYTEFDHPDEIVYLGTATIHERPVVVTDCKDSTIRVWDLETGTNHAEFDHPGEIVHLGAIDDRPVVATWDDDGGLRVWSLDTGAETVTGPHCDTTIGTNTTTPPSVPVVFSRGRDEVLIWDLASRRELAVIGYPPGHAPNLLVGVSANGEIVLRLDLDIAVLSPTTRPKG